MKQLFSKAGVSTLAFMAILVIVLGMFVSNAYNNIKDSRENIESIKNEGTPISLTIEQDINWKNSINDLDKVNWTDGNNYEYKKGKTIEEQNLPDFIKLTDTGEKYHLTTCAEQYDTCGVVMRVKDADTGEIINTIKDEEMIETGEVLFSILGSLVEIETETTSDREWKDDLELDPNSPNYYRNLIYDVEIYTIKDSERVVWGTMSGETSDIWKFNIPNLMWGNDIVETPGQSIFVKSYVSVRN